MEDLAAFHTLGAFVQVVLIDLALAADNAVVIGLAAAGLPQGQRRKAVCLGILAATVLRIGFASVTVQLMQIVGLVLAGGILLLWVCWKMWAELHPDGVRAAFAAWRERRRGLAVPGGQVPDALDDAPAMDKTMRQAIMQIVIADLSMSLDNVLAVAGAAREHPVALVFGLVLSIGLMGTAAMAIARLLETHKWIAYLGLAVVFYVAIRMIAEGWGEVMHVAMLL